MSKYLREEGDLTPEQLDAIVAGDIEEHKKWKKKHPGLTMPSEKDSPSNYLKREWLIGGLIPKGTVVNLIGDRDSAMEFCISMIDLLHRSELHTTLCDFTGLSDDAVCRLIKQFTGYFTLHQTSMSAYDILALASIEQSALLIINPAKYIIGHDMPELCDDMLDTLEKFASSSDMTIVLVSNDITLPVRTHHEVTILNGVNDRGVVQIRSDYCVNSYRYFGSIRELLGE